MTEIPREPPIAGDEVSTFVGSLERQRRTFAWKCFGLDSSAIQKQIGVSSITLGGLVKHLALVEAEYFSFRLHGRGHGEPWESGDWTDGSDWEWRSAADDTPEQLEQLWRDAVERSRILLDEALADGGLEFECKGVDDGEGNRPFLRRIFIDLIEEYARHVGHADLIRESIDGLVGEDAP